MMDLPKYIADMCGIMDQDLANLDPKEPEFEAVKIIPDDDRTVQITWRDQCAGWVQDMPKDSQGHTVRALSVHGKIGRFYTTHSAMEFILSEMS